jgi:hypothetical protein
MNYNKFIGDLEKGKQGEIEIGEYFVTKGFTYTTNPDNDSKWDIKIKGPKGEKTLEIKTDEYYLKKRTNNIAIEVYCKWRKKHSGLMASKADYFIYYFPEENIAYMCGTEKLKEVIRRRMVMEDGGIRRVEGGDGKAAVIYLIDRTICAEEFIIIKIN